MSVEQIIEAWAWVRKNNNSIPDDVLDFMKDSAIAALQNKGEWISVKTNLPKEGVRVLMLCSSKHIEVGYFYREWMSNSSFTSMDERGYSITHWQPLPAAKTNSNQIK